MERTKIGLIGVGRQGVQHARAYQELPDALLLGVYDIDSDKAQNVAKELGVIAFESIEKLLNEVDALSVIIPPEAHYKVAKQILEQGKHVLIEGPISHVEQEARELIDLAAQNSCRLMAGQIERFNAALVALEDVELKPVYIETNRQTSFQLDREDTSIVLEHMLHDIDMVLHLVKSKPSQISANGAAVISQDIDIANARIEFENGCVANLTASRLSTKKIAKTRLYQADAQINLDFIEGNAEIFYLHKSGQTHFKDGTLAISLGNFKNREIKYNRLKRDQVDPLKNEIRYFIAGIRNNLPMISSGRDNLTALEVAHKIIDKINQQQKQLNSSSSQENPVG